MYCTDLSRHIAGLLLQLFVDSSSSGHLSLLHFLISSQSIIHPNDGKTPSKMGCLVHPSLIHHIQSPWNHKKSPWKNHHETTLLNHPIKPAFFPSPMIQWSQWSQWSQVTWLRSPGFHLIRLCTRDLWFHVVGGYGGAVLQVPGGRCLGRSS
jgi:hypothetical protein